MIENKLYTTSEMMETGIYTGDYRKMDVPCQVNSTLVLKACGDRRTLRMFFVLDDGRKIFTPLFWWQQYLGLPDVYPEPQRYPSGQSGADLSGIALASIGFVRTNPACQGFP